MKTARRNSPRPRGAGSRALAVAAALLCAASAQAQGQEQPWIVLVKSDGSIPAHWQRELQDTAKKAADASDKVSWQAPPAVSLQEAELALGCRGFGPACAGQIAGMMNATHALVLEFSADGVGADMTSQVVAVSGDVVAPPRTTKLPDRSARGLAVAQGQVVSAITGSQPTLVLVETDIPKAEVRIDGERVGETPLTLVDKVAPGEHQLTLSLEGRAPMTKTIVVTAGQVNPFSFTLGAGGPAPVEPMVGRAPPSPTVMPTVAWTTTAAGGVLLATAAVLGGVYGYSYSVRKAMVDEALLHDGVVPAGPNGGRMRDYKAMEDIAIPSLVGSVTSAAVGAVLLGTGAALLLIQPAE